MVTTRLQGRASLFLSVVLLAIRPKSPIRRAIRCFRPGA